MIRTTSRRVHAVVVAAVLAVALATAPTPAAAASSYTNVDTIEVDSFVEAGIAVSQRTFAPESTDAVVLATIANFPDGLAASSLAGAFGAPILFTGPLSLAEATAAEIDRLLDEGDTVYVMGGDEAIADEVTDELEATYDVVRLAGGSRIETAVRAAELLEVPTGGEVLIARAFGPGGANTPSDRSTGWVDAVSCGAYAAREAIPLLLTETDVLSEATTDHLAGSPAGTAVICGGETAVSADVADQLEDLGLEVERVAGVTRVETAVAGAKALFGATTAAGGTFTVVNGYGEQFGYGLAAATLGNPILLVGREEPTDCEDESQPSRETLCYLATGTGSDPAEIVLVGDAGLVADEVADAAGAAAGGRDVADLPLLAAPTGVTVVDDVDDDGTRLSVRWQAVADPDDILAGYVVLVDGELAGDAVPTVGPDTTTATVEGLTAAEEVSVVVAALDVGDRPSEGSDPVLATPVDEVPAALTGVEADAGDMQVALAWDRGPVDAASYTVTRAVEEPPLLLVPGGCRTFTELAVVEDPGATGYVDDTAENGTGYCYRISVTDAAGQTSEAVQTEPVVPEEGTPTATIQSPSVRTVESSFPFTPDTVERDVVHAGEPLVIEYTLADTDTPLTDLRVTWEVSTDRGATYGPIAGGSAVAPTFVDVEGGAATFTVPACPTSGQQPAGCVADEGTPADGPSLRYRVTVVDPQDKASRANTGDLEQSRAPGPVAGLAAIPGDGQATVTWDRTTSTTVTGYQVLRQQISGDGEEPDVGDCPTGGYGSAVEVPQPAASHETVSTVLTGLPNGTPSDESFTCVVVRAVRDLDGSPLAGPDVRTAVNPEDGLGGVIALAAPAPGTALDRGQQEAITYDIDLPDGVRADSVALSFCADYDADADTCGDDGGAFTPIGAADLDRTPPAVDGRSTVRWRVPGDARTAQGDGELGAVRAVLSTGGGAVDQATAAGLLFR